MPENSSLNSLHKSKGWGKIEKNNAVGFPFSFKNFGIP